jgi:3D (Asp-Asp-Asp) domain-containing protein
MISFQYGPDTGGYRHYITSRHNGVVSVNTNSIDFWLNNTTTAGGSSTAGVGNVNTMSVTATGVGINCNIPNTSRSLDVNGSINFTGSLYSNGTLFTTSAAVAGINSTGNVGINSASNATYALLVTGAQSNTSSMSIVGNVGIGGAFSTSNTLLITGSQSNTQTLGIAGGTILAGNTGIGGSSNSSNALLVSGTQSNTGNLYIGGATTFTGTTTHSSNVGIFTSSPAAQLDILGGQSSNLIAFQYYQGGGFRHFITSRHDATGGNIATNAIDFYLNTGTTASGSSTAGTSNVNTLSITGAGVGISCNAPAYKLDVNGTTNLNGAVRFKTNTSHIGDDGKVKVFYSSNSATYYLATSHVFQNPSSVNTFTVDSSGNTSNTGTLGVAGLATFANSSNTGTLGVAGTTTFSSNISTRSFTNGRFDIYPTTANNYTIMGLSGGNNIGFIYGDFQLLNDGIHMGYN